jgi:histidinol-phosphate phosphatase family protein
MRINKGSVMSYTVLPRQPLQRPTQAVILAGGRGTRLGPMTRTCPKPMVDIHGKPFLEYLVEMLRDQGFERILLLLGFLPEVIQHYFGDGSRWGIQIAYSVSGADDLTVHRIQLVEAQLDPCFLLMYCDNYWPMQMEKMWPRFVAANVPAMITVYSNKDQYSRDSVRVDEDGYVSVFDRSRTTPGLQGVEISYAILTRSVLDLLPEQDALFEEAVYPQLVAQRQLLAYVTDHRYYSVGSLQRLPLTETFLARRPTVILDRDGVLNKKPPRANYVRAWDEFEWLPGVKEALRLLKEAGFRVIVLSNQAGIARGAMTEEDLQGVHERMTTEVVQAGGRLDAIYYCPHDWDEGCECRKPKPGMLFQAQRDFHLDLSRTVFVGDDDRDAQAAEAAGCPSAQVSDAMPLLDITRKLVQNGGLR